MIVSGIFLAAPTKEPMHQKPHLLFPELDFSLYPVFGHLEIASLALQLLLLVLQSIDGRI